MTGEMHASEVTPENYPLHFAVAKTFGGDVFPFDQYQGPYVTVAAKYSTIENRRFFLSSDNGFIAAWFDEAMLQFSPSFDATAINRVGVMVAVESFRSLIENGGTEEPDWKLPTANHDKIESLTASLADYCTAEDFELPREEFLRMVADRINDDLPANASLQLELATALEQAAEFIAVLQRQGCPAGPVAIPSAINDTIARIATTRRQRRRESAAIQAGLRLLRNCYYRDEDGKEVFVANSSAETEAAALLTRGDTMEPLSPAEIVSLSAFLAE